jgi:hypothetical protein
MLAFMLGSAGVSLLLSAVCASTLIACSADESASGDRSTGGAATASGGSTGGLGGDAAVTTTGGTPTSTGGATGGGGTSSTGGATGGGGTPSTGGRSSTGGTSATGGSTATDAGAEGGAGDCITRRITGIQQVYFPPTAAAYCMSLATPELFEDSSFKCTYYPGQDTSICYSNTGNKLVVEWTNGSVDFYWPTRYGDATRAISDEPLGRITPSASRNGYDIAFADGAAGKCLLANDQDVTLCMRR